MAKAMLIFGLFAASITAYAQTGAETQPTAVNHGDIVIDISGIESNKGEVIISLYDSKKSWLKSPSAMRVSRISPKPPTAQVTFADVPPGTYAIGVLHDEDRNGKLSFRLLPWPRIEEFVGMSQNPTSSIGPPSFEEARFNHTLSDLRLSIRLQR